MKMMNDEECVTKLKGLPIILNEDVLSATIKIPKGKKWDKEDKELAIKHKHNFFRMNKT